MIIKIFDIIFKQSLFRFILFFYNCLINILIHKLIYRLTMKIKLLFINV